MPNSILIDIVLTALSDVRVITLRNVVLSRSHIPGLHFWLQELQVTAGTGTPSLTPGIMKTSLCIDRFSQPATIEMHLKAQCVWLRRATRATSCYAFHLDP